MIITDLSVYEVNSIVNIKGSKLEADEDNASYQWIKCDSSGYSEITNETG